VSWRRRDEDPDFPMRPESIVSIQNLRKCYGETEAVRGLSLEICRGEFFGLLGPNGAGKTTTFGMLTGLIEPTGGSITINGFDLLLRPKELKARMGLVPQGFAFYPTLTARENATFFGRIYGLWGTSLTERINVVLESVRLRDRADQQVATFSNGMKRRLNLALGLLHEPQILILDEPTVGVDTQSRNAILESLEALNQSGVTVLYTTHYIEEAQRLCHRVAILDYGKLIALDTPAALIRGYGRSLIRIGFHEAFDETFLRELECFGSVRILDEQRRGIHLETDRTEEALKDLLALRERRGILFKSIDILEPNLETAFIHLTGRSLRD
jgi:ABC-2 type transport system ATP-binding protein